MRGDSVHTERELDWATEKERKTNEEEARSFISYIRILERKYCWAAAVPPRHNKATHINFGTGGAYPY